MKSLTIENFTLENFEGPLEFLLHLVQKNEIEVYDIPLIQIIDQYVSRYEAIDDQPLDTGAEFVSTAASLHCFKSKTLLPKHEQTDELEEEKEDPRFEIIHHLLDYCRFKQAAKELSQRELKQNQFYLRGSEETDAKKNLGINHLSLTDLASLFKEVVAKAASHTGIIQKETWLVSDKIGFIRDRLKELQTLEFSVLFNALMRREELIVTFLAVLELMKMGKLKVFYNLNNEATFTS